MPKVALYDVEGQQVGDIELSDDIFGVQVNKEAMHQVVKMQLANKRQGTQSALTRGEVSGGGIKPWKQKGTGRARQGSIRAPQWIHGGVVFAPKPRDYSYTVPKKIKRLAMKSALTSKVVDQELVVIDQLALESPKTKVVADMLKAFDAKKALIVVPEKEEVVFKSAKNIENVRIIPVNNLNVYDILKYDKFIITKDAVSKVEEVFA